MLERLKIAFLQAARRATEIHFAVRTKPVIGASQPAAKPGDLRLCEAAGKPLATRIIGVSIRGGTTRETDGEKEARGENSDSVHGPDSIPP